MLKYYFNIKIIVLSMLFNALHENSWVTCNFCTIFQTKRNVWQVQVKIHTCSLEPKSPQIIN